MMRAPDSSFLGWRMVAVAFFVDFIAVGFFFYSYGVFFKAIAIEFGDSRLGVAVGITLTQGVGALLAPFLGRALDRYPLKLIMALGALSMGTGFIALGFSKTALQFSVVATVCCDLICLNTDSASSEFEPFVRMYAVHIALSSTTDDFFMICQQLFPNLGLDRAPFNIDNHKCFCGN